MHSGDFTVVFFVVFFPSLDEDYLDQLLREIHERIKKDNPETSGHFMVYTRHRTRTGAPTVNRRSYNDEELKKFEGKMNIMLNFVIISAEK